MPTTAPPLILVDNLYDRINLYPLATLSSTGDAVGRPVQAVADYRRERSYWQSGTTMTNAYVQTDLGATATAAPDFVFIDRGHNLWGKTVQVMAGNGGGSGSRMSRVVPAAGTVGGDPETTWCVTEEGAIYALFTAGAANRYHIVTVNESWQPIITGIILGNRSQLVQYSGVLDEDAGQRTNRTEESITGYQASDRTYSWRTLLLTLSTIGATEYDATIRYLRRVLFERNQPCVIVQNYGRWPQRAWLYRFDRNEWSMSANRVYRSGQLPMRELGALIR
jgi:hypothetical protein